MNPSIIRTTEELGSLIRKRRKSIGISQTELAKNGNVGPRFIGDLERGKPTCEIGKTLKVLALLGLEVAAGTPEQTDE